jgi:DNA helicase-2/ATP-dependent DNA helicase PcrA
MRQRFEVMTDYILEMAQIQYRIAITTINRNRLKKEIKNMFAGNNDLQVYKAFFEWIGKPAMFKLRKNRTLEYSDLAPLAYLHIALDGKKAQTQVKHLLIDEMQDYSPAQYKVVQKLYPCKKTILGDASQSVNPYGFSTAEIIQKTFITGEVMKLCKSYRSTYEITEFAQKIRLNNELEPVARHGEQPQIIRFENMKEEIDGIAALISSFRKSDYKSLGIICKTEAEAKETVELLKANTTDIHFLSSQSSAFVNGIIVTSAYMAKGLEFDEVIVPLTDKKNYKTEIDRSMLYVAVTRAMHRLSLTCSGEITGLLKR